MTTLCADLSICRPNRSSEYRTSEDVMVGQPARHGRTGGFRMSDDCIRSQVPVSSVGIRDDMLYRRLAEDLIAHAVCRLFVRQAVNDVVIRQACDDISM